MNLAFFDSLDLDYDVATPSERPLGGTESALCYLSSALAARGHLVWMYTGTTKPRDYQGVRCRSYSGVMADAFTGCDALIVCNGPAETCLSVRPHLPRRCRMILWTQHAHDQSPMFALQRPEVRAGWDLIVCVSQWHRAEMQRRYSLDPNRVTVMRNAIGPAFANLFPDAAALAKAKSAMPVLAYTSTPFRGLDVLLSLFPEVRRRDKMVRLRVYSSLKTYGMEESNDPFTSLYAQCRSMPGVEYFGSIAQPLLAESLKSAVILSYPNTFPETSCIAAMEAMAAGMLVVTSDLGALSETTMGMAALVAGPKTAQDLATYVPAYTDRLIAALGEIGADPRRFWQARWEQVRTVTSQCTWAIRAEEWERLLHDRTMP
jgi:glycosyltransferase involved in cell wall biosynthesis